MSASNGNGQPQRVPPTELLARNSGGLAGALFHLADDIAAGRDVDHKAIGSLTKIVGSYCNLARTHIQLEKASVAMRKPVELVIDGKPQSADEQVSS